MQCNARGHLAVIADFAACVRDGIRHLEQNRFEDAERSFKTALEMNSRDDQLLHLVGMSQLRQGRAKDAVASVQRAVSLTKRKAEYHNTLGCALRHLGRFDEALQSFRRAQKLEPDSVNVNFNLGVVLHQLRDFARAAEHFSPMLAHDPRDVDAVVCVARAWQMAGEGVRAIETVRAGLARMPGHQVLDFLLADLLLQEGYFQEGWLKYFARPTRDRFFRAAGRAIPHPDSVALFPADMRGQSVVLCSDQGLGDDLFFLRFAPSLRALGARVEVALDARIVEMVRRSGAVEDCVALNRQILADPRSIPIGDLPGLLGVDTALSATAIYLVPLPNRVAEMRKRLQHLPRPLIGIAWRAGTQREDQDPLRPNMMLFKDVPSAAFNAFAGGLPGTLIVLQRGLLEGEVEALQAAAPGRVADFSNLNADLEGMLALLSLIDDYVGVSSTNVHLLAGLGRGGRVLVTGEGEFRWMARGPQSPWFPGWTVYRLGYGRDWPVVLEEAGDDLRRAISSRQRPDSTQGGGV